MIIKLSTETKSGQRKYTIYVDNEFHKSFDSLSSANKYLTRLTKIAKGITSNVRVVHT